MSTTPKPILPGSTIGIFGGGQLGRMTAMAARAMGYRILVLDPDPACPARFVVDGCIEAAWDDPLEAANLARGCDVVTLEIEQISTRSMDSAAALAPVRPCSAMLSIIQNRIEQKSWLLRNGFPIGRYRAVRSLPELRAAISDLGGRCFAKSATGGYDGRGQGKIGFNPAADPEAEALAAWAALGEGPGVVEQALSLEREISVLVARSPAGEVKVYPAAWNHHENQILAWSVIPAPIPPALEAHAREIAADIAETLRLEGILAIEFFVTNPGAPFRSLDSETWDRTTPGAPLRSLASETGAPTNAGAPGLDSETWDSGSTPFRSLASETRDTGRLFVNELAPRPHNSYHASERACVTGQFEQHVRAICNLPLGDVDVVQPAAIANLLGDLWLNPDGSPRQPRFDAALSVPGLRLHLYEKLRPRPARKMGHLSAAAATPAEAVARVQRAMQLL